MKRLVNTLFSLILILISTSCLVAQSGYQNPVITGFHPDPSVCRVGEDYYLVNSSFEFFPGVPIFHSKDLIHWEKIGHCLTRESQLKLDNSYPSGGIFAPTIRYNNGTFFMITTNITDKGNFLVYTDDPAGEWSEPVWIDQKGIDPSLFFENGTCYLTTNPGDRIYISEINPFTGEILSDKKAIWAGTGGRYPEAPHIYKKDGYYYLVISEGGTEYGHSVTIARSKQIDGPYSPNPANPILTHINAITQASPIQGTGHADFVQATDGSWWVVFLGFRPHSGMHHVLGRETFLSPLRWDTNAWPVINANGTVSLDMNVPTLALSPTPAVNYTTNFDEDLLSNEWVYLRNPNMHNYSLNERPGYLRLKASNTTLDEVASPTWVGVRQKDLNFSTITSLTLNNAQTDAKAGLSLYMSPKAHYDLYIKQLPNNQQKIELAYRLGAIKTVINSVIIKKNEVQLKVEGDKELYHFFYSTDGGKHYHKLDQADTRYLSSETNGGFTGVMISLFTSSPTKKPTAYADFNDFIYKKIK